MKKLRNKRKQPTILQHLHPNFIFSHPTVYSRHEVEGSTKVLIVLCLRPRRLTDKYLNTGHTEGPWKVMTVSYPLKKGELHFTYLKCFVAMSNNYHLLLEAIVY